MIFQLLAIFLIIYSLINFRKAFMLFLLYGLFLNTNINFLSIPGIPILSVFDVLIIVFSTIFYVKYGNKKNGPYSDTKGYFPFATPFILISISWIISTIFAITGFNSAVSACIKNILEVPILTYLMWRTIKTKEDLIFLLKGLTVIFLFCGLYESYEIITQSNPLTDYEVTLVKDRSRVIDFGNYESDESRGFRAKSIFTHPIGAGINFAIYIIIMLFFLLKSKLDIKLNRPIVLTTCLIALACIIMSKSRGPYMFLILGIFAVINLRSSKFYRYAIILTLALIILLPYFSDQFDIFKSFFSSEAQAKVGGSDAGMRFAQLAAAVVLMKMSPIYGLGFKYLNEMSNAFTWALLGSESIWFSVLPQFGLIGIIAYAFMIYWVLIKLPKKYKSSSIFFIGLAYWGVSSLTSTPGMHEYLYFLALILVIKYEIGTFNVIAQTDKKITYKK